MNSEACTPRREEIVAPYFKKDDEWVGFARTLVEKTKMLKA